MTDLATDVLAGRYRALGQAISLVEREDPAAERLLAEIYPATGRARIVGVTGSPGSGQDEIEVIRTVQTNMVVLVPGMGDDIQAIKAGIMEIGDVFVVNKADRPGADRTATEVMTMMSLVEEHGDWVPPIVKTIASH